MWHARRGMKINPPPGSLQLQHLRNIAAVGERKMDGAPPLFCMVRLRPFHRGMVNFLAFPTLWHGSARLGNSHNQARRAIVEACAWQKREGARRSGREGIPYFRIIAAAVFMSLFLLYDWEGREGKEKEAEICLAGRRKGERGGGGGEWGEAKANKYANAQRRRRRYERSASASFAQQN